MKKVMTEKSKVNALKTAWIYRWAFKSGVRAKHTPTF